MVILDFEGEVIITGNYDYSSNVFDFEVDADQENWGKFHNYFTNKNSNLEPITRVTIHDGKQERLISGDGEITRCEIASTGGKTKLIGQIIF